MRLDAMADTGASMPAMPWGALRGTRTERIERMERDARTLARADARRRSRSGAAHTRARAIARARPHTGLDVHQAAASLARLARHNNVAGLARARPDHWVRSPYVWQLVEAGALAGIDRDAAAAEAEKPNGRS